ncbi:MAG: hypothetical protein A2928_01480 [Candidatus Taylorbacteria bacterium RIFCSPLOWO2_01_FULL_45_15b]|uniref:D,D-heptose 1,7-bisphosphate phosphatase n=1 Tax=Candidatus Taylorbacteria bacterium RIFCSPLOWO2_01_FULL_45_15b TaxID=1802319 RepID=A0A1G2NFL2_9BACT|nr:MAG: hypothetical protein A2928_01480 [Candidatus Taylorbacteria bacterium RIFCSPLOWO2_01_FULL_45_15b]
MVCPHDESDRCPCRKPRTALLFEAATKWHLDLDHSFIISNKWEDAEAGRMSGPTAILIRSPWVGQLKGDVDDLRTAVDEIKRITFERQKK